MDSPGMESCHGDELAGCQGDLSVSCSGLAGVPERSLLGFWNIPQDKSDSRM